MYIYIKTNNIQYFQVISHIIMKYSAIIYYCNTVLPLYKTDLNQECYILLQL